MGSTTSRITKIVHGTSLEGYQSIMIMKRILDQVDRASLKILITGQGTPNRKVGQYDDEKLLDEAQGVYFRLETSTTPLDLAKEPGDVFLIFSPDLLSQYKTWVINTEENFGYMISKHGVKGEGQFSGEPGTSWVNHIPPEGVEEITSAAELLIPNSINLDNLVAVVFKTNRAFNKVRGVFKGPTVVLEKKDPVLSLM